jgi:hypothetical protein
MELDSPDLLRVYHSLSSFPALPARSANRLHTSAISSQQGLVTGIGAVLRGAQAVGCKLPARKVQWW